MNITPKMMSAKKAEAKEYVRINGQDAPRPRIIDAILKGQPWPQEPLTFG